MFNNYPYTDFHELNLDWFLNQFKELVADWDTFKTDLTAQWEQVSTDWQTLYNYVHDYFDNLDVQTEIDHKLDEMAQSGQLALIIQPGISTATSAWLAEHITQPTTPAIDTSLTVSGAAADAAVTGTNVRKSLQTFTDNYVNDTWIAANNITDVKQLTKNRIYIMQNVTTTLANMPISTPYNGALIYMQQRVNAFEPLFYIDNYATLYVGQDIGTTIRWKATGQIADYVDSHAFMYSDNVITDTWLTNNNISDVLNLPTNRSYTIQNVTATALANMPYIPALSAYNGSLSLFKTISGYSLLIFVDTEGKTWFGVNIGSEIRWLPSCNLADYEMEMFYNRKVLLLGDSIMYGSHASDYAAGTRTVVTLADSTVYKNNLSTTVWSARFASYAQSKANMTVLNNSFPGARYSDLVTYYDQLVTDTYDYVIMCLGVNDWPAPGNIIPSLTTLYKRFKATNTHMIIMLPLDSTTYTRQVHWAQTYIKQFCKAHNIPVYNLPSTFNMINFIKGHTLSDALIDGVHYTDAVQPDIFEAAKEILGI